MALKKSEKRMLIILGVVVIVVVIFKLVDKPKNKKPTQQSVQNAQTQNQANVNTAPKQPGSLNGVSSKKNVVYDQYNEWGRDPFTIVRPPPKVPKKKPPVKIDVVLKGIFWKDGRAYVLIDDYVLGEGEEEGGIKVERIQGMNVICRKGGRQFTLQWREPS
jgi:hypothetical protein